MFGSQAWPQILVACVTAARATAKETSESPIRTRIFTFTHPKIHRGGSLICFLLVTMLDHKIQYFWKNLH